MTQPLKVNFTSEEAGSTVREVPPSGDYVVNITGGELKEVKPGRKNSGRPYWQLKFVIQEGKYTGTTLISSVMLFEGALYSLAQLMKALGYKLSDGDNDLPGVEDLLGRQLVVRGEKKPARTMPDGTELSERLEIRGYKAAPSGGGPLASNASNSILP